ncbi:hypothetical protein R1flu_014907 [Riccia fluitans]|uniref:Ribosome-recycling factor, chloroplastic n=1 Tax=Riccia fluitans TaxID=41844 RepID=A0ABD1YHF2_9MARC
MASPVLCAARALGGDRCSSSFQLKKQHFIDDGSSRMSVPASAVILSSGLHWNHQNDVRIVTNAGGAPCGSAKACASRPVNLSKSSSNSRRRSTWAQQLSWKKNAAESLVLVSAESVRFASDRSARCATTEEIDFEKELIEEDAMERMEKTLETVKGNFNSVRTGRASPNLLDRVEVEYYGTNVILKSIAQVSTPDGSTILVQPFDKSSLPAIEKAILKSDVGLNPNNDGNNIRLNVPQLTSERRKELLKLVSKLSEDGKVALRNVRRDSIKAYEKLEKEKKLSADNVKDLSQDMQKLTDDYVKKIDALFSEKSKELTTL